MDCGRFYKRYSDLAIKLESALKARGHDVNRSVMNAFYDADKDDVFKRFEGLRGESDLVPLEKGMFHDVSKMFHAYTLCRCMSVKGLGGIGRQCQSYHGMEIALDAHLKLILELQPHHMYMRVRIPLIMIQLGKDNDAYNFIKFWLQNTPKNRGKYDTLTFIISLSFSHTWK